MDQPSQEIMAAVQRGKPNVVLCGESHCGLDLGCRGGFARQCLFLARLRLVLSACLDVGQRPKQEDMGEDGPTRRRVSNN